MKRLLFLLVTIAVTLMGLGDLLAAIRSSSWPSTKGSIVSSGVEHFGSRGRGGRTARARVTYEYEIEGVKYTGNRISALSSRWSHPLGFLEHRKSEEYPVGVMVDVYYCPTEPGKSILEPGIQLGSFILLGLSLLLWFGWLKPDTTNRPAQAPRGGGGRGSSETN